MSLSTNAEREANFNKFHTNNPQVMTALVTSARQYKEQGYTKIGIDLLYSTLRWNQYNKTSKNPGCSYKMNAAYAPYYARLILEKNPDLRGFFSLRKSKNFSDGADFNLQDCFEDNERYGKDEE
jgi:hypothetical protein